MTKQTAIAVKNEAAIQNTPVAFSTLENNPTSATNNNHLQPTMQDVTDFENLFREVELGFEGLSKVKDILDSKQVFDVIDGVIIKDYEDRTNGDVSDKCVFVLEFENGEVKTIMQSATRPRLQIAKLFSAARAFGSTVRLTKVKLAELKTKNIQPAIIFERQAGSQLLKTAIA